MSTLSGVRAPDISLKTASLAAGFGASTLVAVLSLAVLVEEATLVGPQITTLEVAVLMMMATSVAVSSTLSVATATALHNGGGA